jgi:hypothetical protein
MTITVRTVETLAGPLDVDVVGGCLTNRSVNAMQRANREIRILRITAGDWLVECMDPCCGSEPDAPAGTRHFHRSDLFEDRRPWWRRWFR